MSKKILLANGCSHVAGSESPVSFVSILGEKLEMDTINIAKPGAGNDYIMRSTIKYCTENPVDFVLVGWSTHERQEIIFNKDWHYFGVGRIVPDNVKNGYALQKIIELMSLYSCDWDSIAIERTLVHQIALKCFLESKNINYLFFNSWNCLYEASFLELQKEVINEKYYKPYIAVFEEYYKSMPEHFTKSYHGNEIVHHKIADEFYKLLRGE